MKLKLVESLSCPDCKGNLSCIAEAEDYDLPWREVLAGTLTCERCKLEYPIRDGVPRLLPVGQLAAEVSRTVDGFGYEWLTFNEQIKDSYMTDRRHFLDFIHPVEETFFEDKLVLDAGCGMGRFLKLAAEFGGRDVIGMDLSDSVEAAYRNTRALANAHVVQADILHPPFAVKFDYVFSIGVLMCTAHPSGAFRSLANLLGPGGKISAWVYSAENNGWVIRFISPLRERVTSRLPLPLLFLLSHALGLPLFLGLRLIYRPVYEGQIDLGLRQRLPYFDYLGYTSQLNYASLVSVVFDHLVPQLVEYISREEFLSWFQEAQLADVTITPRNNMSWRGLGTRV